MLQFSGPQRGITCSGRLVGMAIAQPEQGGLLPQRTAPRRGTLATTACMETLQVGYLHAVAAAAGCSLSQPFPDNGIDWHVSHSAPGHTVDDEVTIKVQLKCTYQIPPNPPGPALLLPPRQRALGEPPPHPRLRAQDPCRVPRPPIPGRLAARQPRPPG